MLTITASEDLSETRSFKAGVTLELPVAGRAAEFTTALTALS